MRTRPSKSAAADGGLYNYKLVIAYDGTNYAGWQVQSGHNTIQGRIEVPLEDIFGRKVRIHGAGRTDTGVHAHGQVASFKANKRIEPKTLVRALNAHLPEDIRILQAALAPFEFHARFSAKAKEYRYSIVNAPVMDPFLRHHALYHPRKLELVAMQRLARRLAGRHDFAALAATTQREVESTVRTVTAMTITKRGKLITVAVRADGFLYKMVRSIVGALLKVGRGEVTPAEMESYLLGRKRTHYIETAPPHGLCLWKVWY